MSSMDIDTSIERNKETKNEEVVKENGDHSESPMVPFFTFYLHTLFYLLC